MLIEIFVFIIALLAIYKIAGFVSRRFFQGLMATPAPDGETAGGANIKDGFSGHSLNDLQQLFFRTVFSLLGYIARRDGRINEQEIKRTETYMENMGLDAQHRREAIGLFKAGAGPRFDPNISVQNFQRLGRKSPNLTQILLVYLVGLARVDGPLGAQELDAVQEIAKGLGYSNITFEHLLRMISSQSRYNDDPIAAAAAAAGAEASSSGASAGDTQSKKSEQKWRGFSSEQERSHCAYDALGVTPDTSNADIKKAYRTLVSQFHPDKLVGQGLPPFMIHDATERFKKIQAAYDCIMRSRQAKR